MSNHFDHHQPTELEDKAHAETVQHFAESLKQLLASRETVDRLERDIAKISLAANMAAAKPTLTENFIQADGGTQWHTDVELMENIYLCHCRVTGSAEYAVVEHFPARGINEIWNRGWNATEVVKTFTQQQRQTLQVWTEDVSAQAQQFLAENFPGQNLSRVADAFIHRFTHATSHQEAQSHGENHSRGVRI